MTAGLLLLALLAPGTFAAPSDALDPVVRNIYAEGTLLESLGEYDRAAVRYRAVLRADPTFTHATVDLGRVFEAMRDYESAEAAYREAPYDADAVEALGRLLLTLDRPDEAAVAFRTLQDLRTGWPEAHRLEAEALAAIDPHRAAELFTQYLGFPDVDLDADGVARTAVAVHDALREAGDDELARALIEELVERWPEADEVEGLIDRLERARVEDAARQLMGAGAQPLVGELRNQLEEARSEHARGDHEAAAARLEAILEQVPRNPDAWAMLSEVSESLGEVADAEQCIRIAAELAPLDPGHHARLGDLLSTWYGGRYADEAAAAYGRALVHSPAWAEVWYRKGVEEQRVGDLLASHAAMLRYLALAPEGPHAAEARRHVEGFDRERPAVLHLPALDTRPADVPVEAWEAFFRAEVYHRQRKHQEALAELAVVRELAPRFTKGLDLEASIHLELGDQDRAIAMYRRSLEIEPLQPRVLEVLLRVQQQGDGAVAREILQQAAEAGVGDALYLLAVEAVDRGRLGEARDLLDRYAISDRSGDFDEPALELIGHLDEQLVRRRWFGGGALSLAVVALGGLVWWRRAGRSLADLLAAAPGAYPDVARICSAIRHEVLKHNTTLLGAIADALEGGDTEPASWAAERLYGPRGAVVRFEEHLRSLELVGRVHGVRLDLRRRDPVFAPLISAVERLGRLERELHRGGGRRTVAELRELAVALNRTGYRGLATVIRSVSFLVVDEALLRSVWDGVAGESGVELELAVAEEGLRVRIFRGELEDILANVLRNSLRATEQAGRVRLGVRVEAEYDEITGLERVAFRVMDDAPRQISTAMIRSRYVERGLGLTVDLISRNGGSIHVEDEAGWSKAVVIRLPRAEVPPEEEA